MDILSSHREVGLDFTTVNQAGECLLLEYLSGTHDISDIAVSKLLGLGASVHSRDYAGNTCLHKLMNRRIPVTHGGAYDIASWGWILDVLLDAGADPTWVNNYGDAPEDASPKFEELEKSLGLGSLRLDVWDSTIIAHDTASKPLSADILFGWRYPPFYSALFFSSRGTKMDFEICLRMIFSYPRIHRTMWTMICLAVNQRLDFHGIKGVHVSVGGVQVLFAKPYWDASMWNSVCGKANVRLFTDYLDLLDWGGAERHQVSSTFGKKIFLDMEFEHWISGLSREVIAYLDLTYPLDAKDQSFANSFQFLYTVPPDDRRMSSFLFDIAQFLSLCRESGPDHR
jgi:hypothetical protein